MPSLGVIPLPVRRGLVGQYVGHELRAVVAVDKNRAAVNGDEERHYGGGRSAGVDLQGHSPENREVEVL